MKTVTVATMAACFSGNKGAAAMLVSSISHLKEHYGERLRIQLMSTYPKEDKLQNPYSFAEVVSAKPEQLLFAAFPLAILYPVFKHIPPLKKLLLKNRILSAFSQCDLVLDVPGIAFVDSRGPVMNAYAFVCVAVPRLLGVPVVKYSQALGPFNNPLNRFLAKWILPKMELICARGEITRAHLAGIGISGNVRLCADGAFSMPDDQAIVQMVKNRCDGDPFYQGDVVSLSISSVVHSHCQKAGIDYAGIMVEFIDALCEEGSGVLIIANAAREGKVKPRNNDLVICQEVYDRVRDKDKVRWYPIEMRPQEVRAMLGRSRVLVASRFHAMIGALHEEVPVLLVGWSHKYKEVLDMFALGHYAVDYKDLSLETLLREYRNLRQNEAEIRAALHAHLPEVLSSSSQNMKLTCDILDAKLSGRRGGRRS